MITVQARKFGATSTAEFTIEIIDDPDEYDAVLADNNSALNELSEFSPLAR